MFLVPIATDCPILHWTPISLVLGILPLIMLHWFLSIFSNVPSFCLETALSKIKMIIENIPPKTKTENRKIILEKVIGMGFSFSGQLCLGTASIFWSTPYPLSFFSSLFKNFVTGKDFLTPIDFHSSAIFKTISNYTCIRNKVK